MMDAKRAKEVLANANLEKFNVERLASFGWYLSAGSGEKTATLDGEFTADDLEAIATWMRNPSAVVDA